MSVPATPTTIDPTIVGVRGNLLVFVLFAVASIILISVVLVFIVLAIALLGFLIYVVALAAGMCFIKLTLSRAGRGRALGGRLLCDRFS